MNNDDPERGIAWARGGLIFGVAASIAGNVANAALTVSPIHVSLRIPGAIFWPLALFLSIEIWVRNRHRIGRLAVIGRILLFTVSVPTFITSYLNLQAFMVKAGEPGAASITGPLAIDGLLLGCTIMLLAATRATSPSLLPAPAVISDEEVEEILSRWAEENASVPMPPLASFEAPVVENLSLLPDAPVSPAAPRAPRASRNPENHEKVVLALLAGEEKATAARENGLGVSTVYRFSKVLNILRANPAAEIDVRKENVPPALVEFMRSKVRVP